MQIAPELICRNSKGIALRSLVFLIRLKFDNERGFVKDHRIETLSKKFGIPKSTVSRYLIRLKDSGYATVSNNGYLMLPNLNALSGKNKKTLSTVKIHSRMSDQQIIKQLLAKVVRKKLNQMKFLVNVKSDHEKLNSEDVFPKHFNTIKSLIKAEKKYVLRNGLSRKATKELIISDRKIADLFGVSRRHYNQAIKPTMRKGCGITWNVVTKETQHHAEVYRNQKVPWYTFIHQGKVLKMYTQYEVREREVPRKNTNKGTRKKSTEKGGR